MLKMNAPHMWRDMVIVGFAMFAVFFGAGNLIFPPQVGFHTGTDWLPGLLGLLITAMLLPTIGVVAVGLGGGTFERLTRPIAPWFGTVMMVVTMITVAWLVTIPRTAAVAFETGMATLVPATAGAVGKAMFLILYFAISLFFAIDRSSVIDKIGKYLTPALLVLLVGIVVWAIVDPVGQPVAPREANPFTFGFVTGYQTGDVLTGLLFGVLFIEALRRKNYTEDQVFVPMIIGAAAITFVGLFVVYGGLEYLGATGSGLFDEDPGQAALLTGLVSSLAGNLGAKALAIAVILACLTTAVGATAVMATYLAKWTGNRISYRTGAIVTTLVAIVQAFGGVNYIVAMAGPIFMLIYPVAICIAILGLFSRLFTNDGIWKGMAIPTVLIGIYDSLALTGSMLGFSLPQGLQNAYNAIPLAGQGFAWLLPAIVGGVIGGVVWSATGRPSVGNRPEPVAG
ncbi:MAG TPA: branched-chain amino acid transport system II carrier protein [Paracoccus sp. (in: a-proteobacteria)]|mgnify:CR=1 FL=1|uniref:branched-chain amino acid transport system II carrier protein n=1 Tax=uncultured Paracoccus sp. TaxID=189685 RepID=UPI00262B25C6|nr:branched-chain amino acid transport system II carrier protein [uncultured Paracoccus sp.]HMQ42485.1 branched-chain amino acid transport system II carrier protein [Paracoccus sp. (in: a-proteobacteria)]HMR37605.1 branched-chain amino acid transport system II carrier protein [Paracoccus sp. (in: a-proteobacteria)]